MFFIRLIKEHKRVIISQRNSGLGDNLLAAANAWYYAQQTNRSLAIVWQPSRYLAESNANAFSRFFSIPENIEGVPTIVEPSIDTASVVLLSHPLYYLPYPDPILPIYKLVSTITKSVDKRFKERVYKKQRVIDGIIENQEDIKHRALITHGCYEPHDYLKPFFDSISLKPKYQEKVDGFADKYFKNKKVIGVHVRYYNGSMTSSNHTEYWQDQVKALSTCLSKIKQAVVRLKESNYVIFLSTDSRLVQDFLAQSIDNVVFYKKEFGRDLSKELHEELPVETATSTLIEMFLLARSDILVRFPPGSWFSHYASLYAKEIIV